MSPNGTTPLVNWIRYRPHVDSRGSLTELDFRKLPFVPARVFFINHSAPGTVRGRHAHAEGSQLLFCLSGQIEIELRRGEEREVVLCTPDSRGLLITEGIWAQQRYLTQDTVLLAFSSLPFEQERYLGLDGQPLAR